MRVEVVVEVGVERHEVRILGEEVFEVGVEVDAVADVKDAFHSRKRVVRIGVEPDAQAEHVPGSRRSDRNEKQHERERSDLREPL